VKPLRIEIENLRSFRAKRDLDFTNLNLFAIIGDTGAGKTSVLEAITYALYNRSTWNGRNVKELISKGTSTMSVTFTFSVDDDEFTVYRVTKKTGSVPHRLICVARGIDVSGEDAVNKAVNEALQLDEETFLHTVLLRQDRHAELLTTNDDKRNRILAEIFRLDEIGKVSERAKIQEQRASVGLASLERERDSLGAGPAAVAAAQGLVAAADLRLQAARKATARAKLLDEAILEQARQIETAQGRLDRISGALTNVAALREIQTVAEALDTETSSARKDLVAAEKAHTSAHAVTKTLKEKELDRENVRGYKALLDRCALELRERNNEQLQLEAAVRKQPEAEKRARNATVERQTADVALKKVQRELAESEQLAEQYRPKVPGLEAAVADLQRAQSAHDLLAGALAPQEAALKNFEDKLREASTKISAAKQEVVFAEAAAKEARLTAGVAAIAAHLHPGDDCPICERKLPENFAPPAADESNVASTRENAARAAYTLASNVISRLQTEINTARKQVDETKAAIKAAAKIVKTARASLARHLPTAEADPATTLRESKERLQSTEERVRDLRVGREVAGQAALDAAMTATAAVASGESLKDTITKLGQSLEARNVTCRRELAQLPSPFRPPSEDVAGVDAAHVALDAALKSADNAAASLATAASRIAEANASIGRVEQERTRRVVGPRAASLAKLDEIAAFLSLERLPTLETRQSKWIDKTAMAVKVETERATSQMQNVTVAQSEARNEREALIKELGGEPAVVETQAAVAKRDAERDLQQAHTNLERSTDLNKRMSRLEPVKMGLQILKDELGARKFPSYAAQQRQRRLLEIGSTILKDMTQNRYGFTEDFQVFDAVTNESRSPQTLSGGEKFLASMALSLAVVEIAANAGAKIESLFLDEGFASLDSDFLDTAMLELHRRARAGRVICVISHLSEVARFVDNTFLVESTADGSKVTPIAGPIDDDSAIVEGLVSQLATAAQ
jgi:exonuclease SbcC